ncbi:MAG TPA: DOMON-like domain-containing protein [Rhodocyclaceae bacterium]|nr:DOMON-like domain-containing protein [Rhodocyclaceae bacterium]
MFDISDLRCHPAVPCAAVHALHAGTCVLADGGLQLRFQLQGKIDALCIPQHRQAACASLIDQRDELWRHTCFEAFVATSESSAYREYNFSPSGHWAAYAFTDYRQRDMAWRPVQAPKMTFACTADDVLLDVHIPAALLPTLSPDTAGAPIALDVGLTAVIEASDGTLSYWALTHPGTRPDFHQRTAFIVRVAYDTVSHPESDQP